MIVCIAEKPSVAQDIARILQASQRKDGYWEGNGYQVTWTFGHLCELKYPDDYTIVWKRWDLCLLPMIPTRFGIRLKKNQGVEKQFKVIESLFSKAELIVNCGDAGQEGELIQRWVMQKAGVKCPVKRLWISSMTDEAIKEGFAALKPQEDYKSLYEAGLCRAIGDWLLGMNATRLYTMKYGNRQRGASVLSVGRVQTPTLALIVNRQEEIDHFVPEPYWVLTTLYRNTTFTAITTDEDEGGNSRRGFTNEEEAVKALERIKGEEFVVDKVEKKRGKESAPRLFDLTALQVECNKKLGLSAEHTLQVVQSLYEKKVTTYPRVDTTFLPDDVYPKCKNILNGLAGAYGALLEPLRGAKLPKSKKVFNSAKVTDHHAIIPTGQRPINLTQMEKQVFHLIALRFIAIFYPDCKFATTTVLGHAADVPFKVTGKLIVEMGWRTVFAQQHGQEEEEEKEEKETGILPDFKKGEQGAHEPGLAKKMTQAPKPYTEATLLRAMETAGKTVENEELRDAMKDNGIGRPSTRAAIIETLFRRDYIARRKKSIFPTDTGKELIGVIKEELLKSAELTGIWEKKLREIERKEYSGKEFVEGMKQMITHIVQQVVSDPTNRRITQEVANVAEEITAAAEKKKKRTAEKSTEKPKRKIIRAGSKCPKCGEGKIIKGKTAYGCSRWKEGCDYRKPFK